MNNATTLALAALENSGYPSIVKEKIKYLLGTYRAPVDECKRSLEGLVIAEGCSIHGVNWLEVVDQLASRYIQQKEVRQRATPALPPYPVTPALPPYPVIPALPPYPVTPVPQTPTQPTNTGNIDMSKVFTSENYVYGQAVSQMSDEQLISAINRVNGEIKALTSVEADSAKIKAKVAELEAGKASIVAALDGDVATSKKK